MDYIGTIKGVGQIYQQIFVDTYSKIVMAKLYKAMTSGYEMLRTYASANPDR